MNAKRERQLGGLELQRAHREMLIAGDICERKDRSKLQHGFKLESTLVRLHACM